MLKDWIKIGDTKNILNCYNVRKSHNGMYFPCGHCALCRKRVASDWSIRVDYEAKNQYTYNVLLTYNYSNLPYYKNKPTVQRVDIQLFLKRLRYFLSRFLIKVRYFGVAEYGGNYGRPHYHVLLFFNELLNANELKILIYNCWKKGGVNVEHVLSAVGQSIYMTQYMLAPSNGKTYNKITKPFRFMSKGLGRAFLEDAEYKELHDKILQTNCSFMEHNGYKKGVPRYYSNALLTQKYRDQRADRYKQLCKNFDNYLLNLSTKDYERRKENLKQYWLNAKRRELENYNEIKVKHRKTKAERDSKRIYNSYRSAEQIHSLYFG